jgi:hypothetical protein
MSLSRSDRRSTVMRSSRNDKTRCKSKDSIAARVAWSVPAGAGGRHNCLSAAGLEIALCLPQTHFSHLTRRIVCLLQ